MTLSITLKIAVDAPIPSASVSIAIAAHPGVFLRFLTAYRISCPSVSMCTSSSIDLRFNQSLLQQLQAPPIPSRRAELAPMGREPGSFPSSAVRSSDPFLLLFHLRTHPQLSSTPPILKSHTPFPVTYLLGTKVSLPATGF